MSEKGSVSLWLSQLRQGDSLAAQQLWEQYYPRLVGLARRKLADMPRRVADEEDVAVSAFKSFCQRAEDGQFPQLDDRDELWSLLVVITARKAINQVKHERRAKRGGGHVHGESALAGDRVDESGLAGFVGSEPTPEFAAQCAESLQVLLDSLADPTQRLIALWKLEGRTNPEIARHLDCGLTTVERKLRIIRERLASFDEAE